MILPHLKAMEGAPPARTLSAGKAAKQLVCGGARRSL